ncbi:30S ribosome-binding factor RbfA [Pseudoflavonifractor sp. DSM 107456]|uniref:Ribosome-binding factor A n=2 Tax=Pseudoflavonifractor TaxID=1017280 RepID=A0ABR9R8K5_9FIRM|nr:MULTISPECIES: 30S ribosome-binding factor RbfA [Eubacteriales]MBC5729918.1 30S ribosome-binding factor RbfA [Pseudoflavonifractor hominis]MBE5054715.1 30S ribosome-binding factor RbfA [Pseudoflavonifractor gallinarum]MBT9683616.1 30S ribosome-binding factor RbfA [Pseudoflavonifractor sp. MCC625]
MASNRIGRINEEIQRELATLIRTVKDPRVHGLVSITAVETTPDLRFSKIYVSVLDKSDVKEVVKGLKSAAGYLRRELGSALKLRYTPELQFVEDDSIGQGAHILSMLRNPEVVKPANPANAHIDLDAEDEE